MRFFFKTVAANLLAILITLFVLAMVGVVGVVIFVKVAAGTARHETAVHDKSVLVFNMDVAITDAPEHSDPSDILSLSNLASGGGSTSRLTVFEIVNAIDAAAKDNKIVALYLSGSLDTDNAASGYAALREVRQALERFKASGKKIYAYLDEPTVKDYYLASVANEISLNPFGTLSINGLAAESFYLRDALQKYGVGVQVTRVGKYKSYVEMFTEDHMSDADREQLTQLLGGIWNFVSGDMAASRKLDEPTFKQLANGPGVFIAQDALKDKLVDKLAYLDEIIDKLEDVGSYDEDNDTFYQVALSSYAGRLETKRIQAAKITSKSDQIAVVYAEGEIVDGGGSSDNIGGDDLSSTLREVRGDKDVKAVVLRVNSPGGSVLASEVIQREIRKLREAKIPVVVSMGTYAASGGYWISAYGDYIFAEPTTVTGSIGVFGLKFNIKDIANEHGVAFDGVKTTPFADLDTMTRPWTPDEQKLAQTLVDNIYDSFISKVAEGRKLKIDAVQEIAQGRVWTGADAKNLGLVDALGGLGDAIKKAADLAKLTGKTWNIQEYPEKQSTLDTIVQALSQNGEPSPVSKLGGNLNFAGTGHDPFSASLRQLQTQWNFVRTFNDPRGMYVRLPFLLNF